MAGEAGLSQLVRSSVSSITTFSLTPIPLFVLMGEVLFHTGLAVKVIDGIERVIKHVPGRLAVVAVVAGTVFSAISGFDHRNDSDARQPDGADHAVEGLSIQRMATGPIMAIGARRYARFPRAPLPFCWGVSPASRSPNSSSGELCRACILSVLFVGWIILRTLSKP